MNRLLKLARFGAGETTVNRSTFVVSQWGFRLLAASLIALAFGAFASSAFSQERSGERSTLAATGSDPQTPVMGGAAKETIPTTNVFGIVSKGGMMMYPIIASSILLFVFVFERSLVLRHGRVVPSHFVKRLFHQIRERQLTKETAIEVCQENHSPIAEVFVHALRKWGRPAVEIEQAVLDSGERLANHLRKHLRVMNTIATIAPLMGLLGTVTGMIAAFNSISSQQGMGRPELLASGISEALVTTASGLIVAIPAIAFYMFFVGRVDGLVVAIDGAGQELVNLISAEGLAAAPPKTKTSKKAAAAAAQPAAAAA